jgi:hypothetical protein
MKPPAEWVEGWHHHHGLLLSLLLSTNLLACQGFASCYQTHKFESSISSTSTTFFVRLVTVIRHRKVLIA